MAREITYVGVGELQPHLNLNERKKKKKKDCNSSQFTTLTTLNSL